MTRLHRDQSSTDDIQQALERACGDWVSAKELAAIRAEYKRPIWQIRHERHIKVKNGKRHVNGATHGYYRIPRYEGEPDPPLPEPCRLTATGVDHPLPGTFTPIGTNEQSACKVEANRELNASNPKTENLFHNLSDVREFCSYETGGRR